MTEAKKLRSTCVFIFLFGAYVAIVINLLYLQVFNSSFLSKLGKKQYAVTTTMLPPRALIYDRNNKPVAMNAECISAFILPRQLEQPAMLAEFLKKNFPAAYQRWQDHKDRHFLYVKRRLAPYEIALIERQKNTDIQLIKEPCRFYPFQTMGTLLGTTDIDNNGLFGIELMRNQQLRGTPTTCTLERDARSFYFDKTLHKPGVLGKPVYLTVDSELQFLAHNEVKDAMEHWKGQEGGAVIIDGTTGALITSVSYPDFNPNSDKTPDPYTTKNFPFTQAYEVGSVIKTFAAMAALEAGVVTPEEKIDCENKVTAYVNGFKINTPHEHGVLSFSEVIEESNNIGTVKVIMRMGGELYDYYKRLGFARKTPINFPGEQSGFLNPPNRWSNRSIISLSYGYEFRTTIMQLAQAFCIIANGGRPLTLHLFKDEVSHEQQAPVYSARTIQQIREILTKTVQEGTAKRARIKGYTVMGKTGTAEKVVDGHYSKTKNLYTFAGIIEKGAYKRVIVVYISDIAVPHYKIYAAQVSAPLFERIAEKMLIHEKIL